VCERGRPIGNRLLSESSLAPRYQSVSLLPCPRQQPQRGLILPAERLRSVLVVFELDHRLILLEPFQKLHTSQFCAIASFQLHGSLDFSIGV
jgi:hypothetical protein